MAGGLPWQRAIWKRRAKGEGGEGEEEKKKNKKEKREREKGRRKKEEPLRIRRSFEVVKVGKRSPQAKNFRVKK